MKASRIERRNSLAQAVVWSGLTESLKGGRCRSHGRLNVEGRVGSTGFRTNWRASRAEFQARSGISSSIIDRADIASAGANRLPVTERDRVSLRAEINITRTALGIFTANSNGHGVYAGHVIHMHADGSQASGSSAILDTSQNTYLPNPIDMGPPDDRFPWSYTVSDRRRLSDADVTATINGMSIALTSAAQGTYPGLDQVNLELPREIAGAGTVEIVLTVEGQAATRWPYPSNKIVCLRLRRHDGTHRTASSSGATGNLAIACPTRPAG